MPIAMPSTSRISSGNGSHLPTSLSSATTIRKRLNKATTILVPASTLDQNDRPPPPPTTTTTTTTHELLQPTSIIYTNSIASFQSESVSSKFKFEIPSDSTHYQSSRSRVQWSSRQPTKVNSMISSNDFNATNMNTSQLQQSLNDTTEADQTLKCTSMTIITSDDDDVEPKIEVKPTIPSPIRSKTLVDQASQVFAEEFKMKNKSPSASSRKKISTSATKRPKTTNATPIAPFSIPSTPATESTTTATKPSTSSMAKSDESNANKNIISVDLSKARSNLEVVRLCLRELGWKECLNNNNGDSDIFWHSSSFQEGNSNQAFSSGRVNKFPGMNDLLRKVHLTRSLNNMRLLFPQDFEFYPKTWFLPEQTQQFKDDVRYLHQQDKKLNRSLTTFIVKPSDGSQGEGIYLIRDPNQCNGINRPHVVQEYIDRPLLMNGLKFDLRIYVLILNLYPLEILLYDEGLVRFATVGYKAPSTENLHQAFMHLTNYSLNKRSASYKHTIDSKQTDGSKRKLTTVWTQLSQIYGPDRIERTKLMITEMINKTVLAILPELRVEYEFELPLGKKQNISCFQIIGFDIILTDQLKPILLEVNANPSLRIDFDKEGDAGKTVYQPSPIDEEIKKPLVLETLKLALPKKKLQHYARHAQAQVSDELIAQHVEKVAQRRVEERNEKIKSARKSRFDMKSNPFFSRPSDSISKEFARLQLEQQQLNQQLNESQKVLISSPNQGFQGNSSLLSTSSNNDSINQSETKPTPMPRKLSPKKTTKNLNLTGEEIEDDDDDDESGTPASPTTETTNRTMANNSFQTASTTTTTTTVKRSVIKTVGNRPLTTLDAVKIGSIKTLKLIFPTTYKSRYRHLLILDKIAYIYIQLVVMLGHKTMTGGQFRSFANICGIINETITSSSIDILYYQILRKWQQFVLRTTITGLPFAAFIEAFFLLSQRKYPSSHTLIDSVSQLVTICIRQINTCLQAPSSPLIQQSNQYLLHRATRMSQTNLNPSSMTQRSNMITLRPTTNATHRSLIAPSSAPTPRVTQTHHLTTSATAVTSIHSKISSTTNATVTTSVTTHSDNKPRQQSTKSVFPLFFDVL